MHLAFADQPLFFPVTAFDADGLLDLDRTLEHIGSRLDADPGGVFPACGTGEFHALAPDEALRVTAGTVQLVAGRVPVIAGVGGSVGQAVASMRALADVGVDGVLLLPPYLVAGTSDGLAAYVETVARAAPLPVIVYHRGSARFSAELYAELLERNPAIVGFKDGVGDVALATEIVVRAAAVRDHVQFFNGLRTAEVSQAAYRAIGVPLYSSAVFAMAPDIAGAFYTAYRADDRARMDALLDAFYFPLVALRDMRAVATRLEGWAQPIKYDDLD